MEKRISLQAENNLLGTLKALNALSAIILFSSESRYVWRLTYTEF